MQTLQKQTFAEATMPFLACLYKALSSFAECDLWVLHSASAMMYQVCYRASLLYQKSHTYGAGYEMQTS